MPALITIGIIILLFYPKRKRPAPKRCRIYTTPRTFQPTAPAVYDPIKLQKEQDRQRREQERQADRARKEAERKRKEEDRAKKEQEEKEAAQDKINWLAAMIEKYSNLSEQIETELTENTGLTEYKRIQLQKQLLQFEEKIYKYREQQNKAYYIVNR